MRKLLIFMLLICPAVWASVGLSGVKLSNVKVTPFYTPEAAFTMGDGTLLNGAVTTLRSYNRAIGGYNVRIPAYINGNPVKRIKQGVFKTDITFPDPAPKLKNITFPATLEYIERQACYNNDFTAVSFGNKLQFIGDGAFQKNKITSLVIPDSVTTITNSTFADNQISSLTLGRGLTTVGTSVFWNNQLTEITLPDNIAIVDWGAFLNNPIINITIPANVIIIDNNSMGTYGTAFKALYDGNGKLAGTYVYADGAWGKL